MYKIFEDVMVMLYKIKNNNFLCLAIAIFFCLFFFNTQQIFAINIDKNISNISDIKTKQYKVRRGDNLWVIAKRNKPSRKVATARMLEVIKTLNKTNLINGTKLHAGMKLVLPATANGVYDILRKKENAIKFHSEINQKNEMISKNSHIKNKDFKITSSGDFKKTSLDPKNKAAQSLISSNNKILNSQSSYKTQNNTSLIKNKSTNKLPKTHNNSENNAWILLTVFFMLTSLFLYWRMQKLSKDSSGAQGSAARRLGVKSRSNNISQNSSSNLNNMHVSMPTRSEPKLNIQVNPDVYDNDNYYDDEDGLLNNNPNNQKLLDELAKVKTRIQAAPDSVDLRLDLLRKLVQLDDQEGFKKAVDELTPLLTEAHQTVWSDIRSMYFGKWAYDS